MVGPPPIGGVPRAPRAAGRALVVLPLRRARAPPAPATRGAAPQPAPARGAPAGGARPRSPPISAGGPRGAGRDGRGPRGGGMPATLSDLDGVLVASRASIMRAWRAWGARHGIEEQAVAAVEHGRPSGEIIAALVPGLDAAAEEVAINAIQAQDTGDIAALPGAAELLGGGHEPLAIVTSCTVALAKARLRAAGLPVPRVLVTPERLTRGKPDPEGYLLAATTLGAAPGDCVVLEDSHAGV